MTVAGGSRIADNRAETTSADGASSTGGGVVLSRATLTVTGSAVSGNVAKAFSDGMGLEPSASAQGGAISATGSTPEVAIAFQDSSLTDNRAEADTMFLSTSGSANGGAIHARSGTSTSTVRVTFDQSVGSGNVAVADGSAGGGLWFGTAGTGDAQVLFISDRSTLSENRAESTEMGTARGGALHLDSGTGDAIATVHLNTSTVAANQATSAQGSGQGGAVEGSTGTGRAIVNIEMSSATIFGNTATSTSGGLHLRQGISSSVVNVGIRNTIVAGNVAPTNTDCTTDASSGETLVLTSGGYI